MILGRVRAGPFAGLEASCWRSETGVWKILQSRSTHTDTDGIGDGIQFAGRQFAQPVEETGFRDGLHLKGVGPRFLRQTVGGRWGEVYKPGIARIPRFPL